MSASLVGSEMCIRDSLPPPRLLMPGKLPFGTCPSRAAPVGQQLRDNTACLLYTSDAADDM
eukprot:2642421-Alexandrium_andersonii.AAC.1